VIIHQAYQFKLKPTAEQEQLFRQYCGAVRWVYNHMLAQRSAALQAGQNAPTTNEQIKQLPLLKRQSETAWLREPHSQVLQDAVLNLDDAFARFFKKKSRFPRFKKKHGNRQSFSFPQSVQVNGNWVFLPKIGWVAFRRSPKRNRYREIVGTIKQATIRHKASGWYVSIVTQQEGADPKAVEITQTNSVGLDLGSIDLVTTSAGMKYPNPRYYRKTESKLQRTQRKLSRKQKGSNNYHKQRQRVARLHEKIANRRLDTLHKLSRQLVDENQAIFCEDLNARGIAKRMGKSVGDAAWGEFVRQLKYKTKWRGKTCVQVDRWFASSQICSGCGHQNTDLKLSERIWKCPRCGRLHDRDFNAAINLHDEGLKYVAAGLSETLNACGETVRLSQSARLAEARISRL